MPPAFLPILALQCLAVILARIYCSHNGTRLLRYRCLRERKRERKKNPLYIFSRLTKSAFHHVLTRPYARRNALTRKSRVISSFWQPWLWGRKKDNTSTHLTFPLPQLRPLSEEEEAAAIYNYLDQIRDCDRKFIDWVSNCRNQEEVDCPTDQTDGRDEIWNLLGRGQLIFSWKNLDEPFVDVLCSNFSFRPESRSVCCFGCWGWA
jgi:hypothetical protein